MRFFGITMILSGVRTTCSAPAASVQPARRSTRTNRRKNVFMMDANLLLGFASPRETIAGLLRPRRYIRIRFVEPRGSRLTSVDGAAAAEARIRRLLQWTRPPA